MLKAVLGAFLLGLVLLYGYFFWTTQRWTNFNPDYVKALDLAGKSAACRRAGCAADRHHRHIGRGDDPDRAAAQTCRRSAIVEVTADLVDFNVNQNAWISSMILYKLGLFGIDWDRTPFFDNKAAFQRGVHQAIRRTSIELVDTLGRVRGTSQIDSNLQSARGNLQFDEFDLVFRLEPIRSQDADAELLSRRHRRPQSLQRAAGEMRGRIRRARRQSAAIHRPHRQRYRRDLGDPARAFRELQSRLVRPAGRRPLLVRLWATLRLLRHPRGGARRLQGRDRPARTDSALGGARGPASRGAEHSAA